MGGRGASSSGGGTGGVNVGRVLGTTSLISKEGKQNEIAQALTVLRDVEDKYGVIVTDAQVAFMPAGSRAMAYYDVNGNVAVNNAYFDAAKMDAAYDRDVKSGYHPDRGEKTGIEAVIAHEMGHRLTDEAAIKQGRGAWQLESASSDMIAEAAKKAGYGNKTSDFVKKISGYATKNPAEAVAEAFADVYCNGRKASRESRALTGVLIKYLKGGAK